MDFAYFLLCFLNIHYTIIMSSSKRTSTLNVFEVCLYKDEINERKQTDEISLESNQ